VKYKHLIVTCQNNKYWIKTSYEKYTTQALKDIEKGIDVSQNIMISNKIDSILMSLLILAESLKKKMKI